MIGRVTEALSKVKGSIGSNERHALPGVIGDDLLRFGKLPLCLFICIIITAITVVTTAHHTRLLTAQREQLVLERPVVLEDRPARPCVFVDFSVTIHALSPFFPRFDCIPARSGIYFGKRR